MTESEKHESAVQGVNSDEVDVDSLRMSLGWYANLKQVSSSTSVAVTILAYLMLRIVVGLNGNYRDPLHTNVIMELIIAIMFFITLYRYSKGNQPRTFLISVTKVSLLLAVFMRVVSGTLQFKTSQFNTPTLFATLALCLIVTFAVSIDMRRVTLEADARADKELGLEPTVVYEKPKFWFRYVIMAFALYWVLGACGLLGGFGATKPNCHDRLSSQYFNGDLSDSQYQSNLNSQCGENN